VLFLGVWEQLNNPDFNSREFERIRNEAGRNSFYLSAKKWIEATGAVGIYAKAGRYGGTYAHKDIAFEFGSWLSPEFKLYLIKEFQRLKDEESRTLALEWNFQRTLAKVNYKIHSVRAIQSSSFSHIGLQFVDCSGESPEVIELPAINFHDSSTLIRFDTFYELADARKLSRIGSGDPLRLRCHLRLQEAQKAK
jgi:hypothetical protein